MYTKELILDTVLNAFYKNDIQEFEEESPYIVDYILAPDYSVITNDQAVVDNTGDIVYDNSESVVIVQRRQQTSGQTRLKYLTAKYPHLCVAMYRDFGFRDWRSHDGFGLDAEAYMITGHETLQDAQRKKQAPYITCHFERTETAFVPNPSGGMDLEAPSGCKMQAQWDFANSPVSGKFGPEQQVYRLIRHLIPEAPDQGFDNGYNVVTTKNKVKGRGRALSLLFKTEPDKDCRLLGWGVKFLGNENV